MQDTREIVVPYATADIAVAVEQLATQIVLMAAQPGGDCRPAALSWRNEPTTLRLGVDVKKAADGLIHPLGPNGKPQGIF